MVGLRVRDVTCVVQPSGLKDNVNPDKLVNKPINSVCRWC